VTQHAASHLHRDHQRHRHDEDNRRGAGSTQWHNQHDQKASSPGRSPTTIRGTTDPDPGRKRALGDHLGTTRPARGQTTRTSIGRAHGTDTTSDQDRRLLPRPGGQVRSPRPMSMTSIVRGHGDEQDVLLGEELHPGAAVTSITTSTTTDDREHPRTRAGG